MGEMITSKGWDTFTSQPEPAAVSIVKEFYANLDYTPPFQTMVRGKTVSFSREAINAFYNLRGYDSCQYARYIAEGPKYDRIVSELCRPGTEWKLHKYTRELTSFPVSGLSRYGKVWYAFLSAKLMPSAHVSDVMKDKAILLYAMITGMNIDVGSVIAASITKNLKMSARGLGHPSLITALCRNAGVRWGVEEQLQPPMTTLDHKLIERYSVGDPLEPHPRGLGFLPSDHPSQDDAAGSSEQGAAAAGSKAVRRLQRRMDGQFEMMHRLNERIAERQDVMHAYTYTCASSLADMLAHLHPGATFPQRPPPPPLLPSYPPSDSEEEEEAEDAAPADQ